MTEKLQEKIDTVLDTDLANVAITFDHEDILDSRDIDAKIEEFESEFNSRMDTLKESSGEELEVAEEDFENWLDENMDEFVSLLAFREEAEQYTSEWKYGATIINDDFFEDYAKQLAEDIGAIDWSQSWPLTCIDWAEAANQLKQDYAEFDFDGNTYYVQ
jgi:hypothetical protein